jgi:hypothetical protein
VLSEFIGIFFAVLTVAIVLAAMCLFSLAKTAAGASMQAAGQ